MESKYRYTKRYIDWQKKVLEKDNFECQHCFIKEKLIAHHIIPWKNSRELRFEVSNGLTLCRSCHMKHHYENATKRWKKGNIPWNKGLKGVGGGPPKGIKFTEEHKEKLKKAKTGYISWNKNIPMKESTKEMFRKKFKDKKWKINPETGKRIWID